MVTKPNASANNSQNVVPHPSAFGRANPYLPRGGGTGGPSNPFDGGNDSGSGDIIARITLEQNVKGLNIAVGVLFAAFGAAFLFMLDRVDGVSDKITEVRVAVAQQSTSLASVIEGVSRIEGKLDEKSRPNPVVSAPAKQTE